MAQTGSREALDAPARLALGFAAAVAAVCIVTAVLAGRLEGAEIALLACASVVLAAVIVQAIAALARGQDRLLERLDAIGGGAGAPTAIAAPALQTLELPDVASLDDAELKSLHAELRDEVERRRGRGGGARPRPDPATLIQAEAHLSAARAAARDRTARKPRAPAQVKRS